MTNFIDDYARGMEMLLISNPSFAAVVRNLGMPHPNETIPSAQVSFDMAQEKILFEINPNFIRDMDDSEIAAVIAHETYHVILNHLNDLKNKDEYPETLVLRDALECIINDGLKDNVGFTTGPDTFHGPVAYGQDFSMFSTREGYEFILSKQDEDDSDSDANEDSDEASDSSGSNSGSGGSSSSNSDSNDSGSEDASGSDEKDEEESSSDESDADSDGSEGNDSDDSDEAEANSSGSDDSDASDEDDSEAGSGGASGNSENEDDSSNEGSASGSSSSDGSPSGSGAPMPCGGVHMIGDGTDQDIKDMISKAMTAAAKELDPKTTPSEIIEMFEELQEIDGMDIPDIRFDFSRPDDNFTDIGNPYGLDLNWLDILAEINPKVKSSGGDKYKTSWHAPRRKTMHMYPDVILPNRVKKGGDKDKGDALPTLILALDMSPSIPTHLLKNLASLAMSIPENLIKAYPITWSSTYKIFDPENPNAIVTRYSTVIASVWDYSREIKRITGKEPYVLTITDGEFGVPGHMKRDVLESHWSWMAIQDHDVRELKRNQHNGINVDRIYKLSEFSHV